VPDFVVIVQAASIAVQVAALAATAAFIDCLSFTSTKGQVAVQADTPPLVVMVRQCPTAAPAAEVAAQVAAALEEVEIAI
jgi:hypothetical protein